MFERSEFARTPPAASTAGCPQRSGGTQHAGSPFFGSFLWRSKERDSPAGAKSPPPDPSRAAQRRPAAAHESRGQPSPQPSPRGRGSKSEQPGATPTTVNGSQAGRGPHPNPLPEGEGASPGSRVVGSPTVSGRLAGRGPHPHLLPEGEGARQDSRAAARSRSQPPHPTCAIASPSRTAPPGAHADSNRTPAAFGNSITTVDPSKNRPISAPLAIRTSWSS